MRCMECVPIKGLVLELLFDVMVATTNKSLGQHWLYDRDTLIEMCDAAEISNQDVVLEIGPGLGTLTRQLAQRAKKVIAVEFDAGLAAKLAPQFPGDKVSIVPQDFLRYDLTELPSGYKVAANVPYYITSKIVERLLTSENPPAVASLLVQKEVAERMAAKPGDMSILAIAVQLYSEVTLGSVVPAELFTPPPRVDSQIVTLRRRQEPLFPDINEKQFFRVVKAGFSAKRKKLRSSISAGLGLSKDQAERILRAAAIDSNARAETLSLEDWHRLMKCSS